MTHTLQPGNSMVIEVMMWFCCGHHVQAGLKIHRFATIPHALPGPVPAWGWTGLCLNQPVLEPACVWTGLCLYRQLTYYCHRWRHLTLKGQGRDPNIFKARYFENGSRWRCGYNRAPTGNDMRERCRHVTQKSESRDLVIFICKYLENGLR